VHKKSNLGFERCQPDRRLWVPWKWLRVAPAGAPSPGVGAFPSYSTFFPSMALALQFFPLSSDFLQACENA
jgi:hypothetical protein